MDNTRLSEIRDRLEELPVLQGRLRELDAKIAGAKENVKNLQERYDAESLDVENMMRESLSGSILKLLGKYEGKLEKESQEELAAKLEYDRARSRLDELVQSRGGLYGRISELCSDRQAYEDELKRREEEIQANTSSGAYEKYRKLEEERSSLSRQLTETQEAMDAAKRARDTVYSAEEQLDGADRWATFDVWTRGGIISHLAKYEHIDNAQELFNRLDSQLEDMRRELSDVQLYETPEFSGIDRTTRTIDFWLDNIFTDLNVRGRIREDRSRLELLDRKLDEIVGRLEKNRQDISSRIGSLESKKKELLENEAHAE